MAADDSLNKGNVENFIRLAQDILVRFSNTAKDKNVYESYLQYARDGQEVINSLTGFERLGLIPDTPSPRETDDDQTYGQGIEAGMDQFFTKGILALGAGGRGTASSVAEALLIANAIAMTIQTDAIFYRGEDRYGHKLVSRAERKLSDVDLGVGISTRELSELRRFQAEVKADANLTAEIFPGSQPEDQDPAWLPAMQHYDQEFGTRLLDLTRSIFAALHFAVISWKGLIDTERDGLLYLFIKKHSPWRYDDYGLLAPTHLQQPNRLDGAFHGWPSPELFRLYQEPAANPRSLAQDGVFLVRSDITADASYGQVLKIRIPAGAKLQIAQELWLAGYTPNRIVRGEAGRQGHEQVAARLGFNA